MSQPSLNKFVLLAGLCLVLCSSKLYGQATVTPATGGEICLNAGPSTSDYYTLSDIVITETNPTDFTSTSPAPFWETFVLTISGGSFEFKPGVGTVTVTGSGFDINPTSPNVTSTSITIELGLYNASDAAINSLIISGIQVRATAAGSGQIIRSGGSQPINGDDVGDGVNHGTLNAYEPPIASLTDDKGSTICANELITFTGSVTNGKTAANYEFILDPNGARTSLQSSASSTYSTSSLSNGDEISVVITDTDGCSDESNILTITVNPGFSTSLAVNENPVCDPNSQTFTATASSGSVTQVDFYVNGSLAATDNTSPYEYTANLSNNDQVYAIATDPSCSSTSNTITVSTVPLPSDALSVVPTNSTVCINETAEITVQASETNVEYTLLDASDNSVLSSTFLGNGGDLVITSTPLSANVTIKVRASSTLASSCAVDLLDTEAITIQNTAPPTASNPSPICVNDPVPQVSATGTAIKWYDDVALTNLVGTGSPFDPSAVVDNTTPGTYRLYVTQTVSGCESPYNIVDVGVNPLPNTSLTVNYSSTTVCDGETITVTVQSSESGVDYQVFDNNNSSVSTTVAGTGGNINITTSSLTTTQNSIYVKATNASTGCTDNFTSQVITVNALPGTPTISSSGSTVCDGADPDVTLTSSAAPNGGNYQWYKDGVILVGATSQSYAVNGPGNSGDYTVTVTDGSTGCVSAQSAAETVTINALPNTGLTISYSATSVCEGSTITVTVQTSELGVSYELFDDTNTSVSSTVGGTGGDINLVTSALATSQSSLLVRATNSTTSCTADFAPQAISVDAQPTSDAGADDEVCASQATYSVSGSTSSNGTITWTSSSGGTFADPSVDNPTYNISATDVSNGTVTLTKTVSSPGACADAVSSMTLTITPAVVASAGAAGETCEDASYTVGDASASNYASVLWTHDGNGSFVTGSETTLTPTYTPVAADAGNVVTLTMTVSGNGSCGNVVTTKAVTVNPVPDVAATDQTICSGTSTNIAISNPNGVTGTTFAWTVSNVNNVTGASGGSGSTIAQSLTVTDGVSQGTVDYVITPTAGSCSGSPLTVTVTVDPVPDVSASDQTICSGEVSSVAISNPNGVSGTSFSWTLGTVNNVSGASAGSGNVIAQTLTVTDGVSQGTVDYVITPSANGCDGSPLTITVTVNSVPDVAATPNGESICSGQSTNIALSTPNGVAGVTYNWTVSASASISGATAGSGNTIAQVLTNSSNTSGLVTYTITPVAAGCQGTPINVNVVVEPIPDIATSGNETICSGNSTNIMLSNPNNVAGTSFSWTIQSNTNVSGASAGTGVDIIQTLSATDGTNTGTVVYEVTAFTGACTGAVTTVTVTVNPDVNVNSGGDQVICEGSNLTLGGSITGGVTTGTWSTSGDGTFDNVNFGVGTVYIPGSGDISSGSVTITLTADDADGPGGPCPVRSDQFTLTINPIATVSVPADYTVCEPSSIDLTGTIGGGATFGLWQVVTGNGALSSSSQTGNTITASYVPDVSDVGTVVTFSLTTNDPDGPSGPCTNVSDVINITIDEAAKVNAGTDQEVCEDAVAALNGNIYGSVSTGTWTIVSGGDGSFDNPNDPTTNYNPGPNDKLNGATVTLRLTSADPGTTCGIVFDETVVKVNKLPEVLLTGLNPIYQEDAPPVQLTGFPTVGGTGVFSGPGVVGDQFYPNIANLTPVVNTIVYTFTNATTGCTNSDSVDVIVNPVTTVDFTIETANLNSNDELEICSNVGLLKIQGIPDISTGLSGGFSSVDPTMQARITIVSGEFYVDTDGLPSNLYDITYTYTNSLGAVSTKTRFVKVFAGPVADFNIGNFCVDSPIVFTDQSTIGSSPFGGAVVAWDWTFGDGTVSTLQNPTHVYASEGTYDITLTVTTDQGCTSTLTKTNQTFGAVPMVTFEATSFCTGETTNYLSTVSWGTQIPSAIVDYTWDYGDGNIESTGTNNATSHQYPSNGVYNTTVTVTTTEGCQASDTQPIAIFPYTTVDIVTEYLESFEDNTHGWVAGANGTDTSWVVGPPTGTVINSASDGVNAWWTGSNPDPNEYYYNSEDSYVDAPCFDLTNLSRPMISMDIWNDTQDGFDGAIVQYSTNGGITWFTVGEIDKGVNWYNRTGILAKPGGDQNGWSGATGGWVTARYSLEQIPVAQRDQVRLRVVFGSNDDNPINSGLNGFAFDNVNIRDRDRLILVENFVNLSRNYQQVADRMVDFSNQRPTDFVYLNYHIADGIDSLYDDNKQDPQNRANNYGISQAPNTALDGNIYLGGTLGWNIDEIDRRALVDPQFDIDLQLLPTSEDSISVRWTVTAKETVNNPIVVHTIVIEEQVVAGSATAHNVVKKMLPNAAGSSRQDLVSFNPGDVYSSARLDWAIDVPLYAPDQLAVIVFVQEKTTGNKAGEVYQAAYAKITDNKKSPIVTGLDEVLNYLAESIEVYPNPVANDMYFATPHDTGDMLNWKLVDQRGITLAADTFRFVNGEYVVDTSEIPNGIYYLIISAKDQPLTYKKVIIMHR